MNLHQLTDQISKWRPRVMIMLGALCLWGCGQGDGLFGQGGSLPTATGRYIPTTSGQPLSQSEPIFAVADRVLPVAQQLCLAQGRVQSCDFILAVDDDPQAEPNAFQTVDGSGRPVIVFTASLLKMARNPDELAFVLGHEAAHHIAGHLPQREEQKRAGAILAGVLARVTGFSRDDSKRISEMGSEMAGQQYAKQFELEADSLGAQVAYFAKYDPMLGANFFLRLPDPGPNSQSSHPANAQRQAAVAQAVMALDAAAGF